MVVEWIHMSRSISVGIDVGSQHVRVVMVELVDLEDQKNKGKTRVLGTGVADSYGVENGFVTNIKECSQSITNALLATEKSTGVKIKKVNIGISGVGVSGHIFHGAVNINKNDGEVSVNDVLRVQENAQTEIPESLLVNRKILHAFPLQYKIDGKTVLGHPQGLKGNKLEVKIFAITSLSHHFNDLINSIEEAGVKVEDAIAGPLLVSSNAISKAEKKAGVGIINIRSETMSIIVYEDNMPISLEIFPIGSNNITNDIALGLKTSLEEAEEIKLGRKQGLYSKRKLDEIINARLADMFELIEAHLQKISRNRLLPAGIVLLGGGSKLPGVESFAKNYLKLPTRKIEDKPEWMKAYGAAMYGLFPEDIIEVEEGPTGIGFGLFAPVLKWLKQFLP